MIKQSSFIIYHFTFIIGLTDGLPDLLTGLAWNASEPQGLVGSTPTPSAVSVV